MVSFPESREYILSHSIGVSIGTAHDDPHKAYKELKPEKKMEKRRSVVYCNRHLEYHYSHPENCTQKDKYIWAESARKRYIWRS